MNGASSSKKVAKKTLKLTLLLFLLPPSIYILVILRLEGLGLLSDTFIDLFREEPFFGYSLITACLLLIVLNWNIARGGPEILSIFLPLLASSIIWFFVPYKGWDYLLKIGPDLWIILWVTLVFGFAIRFQPKIQQFLLKNARSNYFLCLLGALIGIVFLYSAYLLAWLAVVTVTGYYTGDAGMAFMFILPFGLIVSTAIGFVNALSHFLLVEKRFFGHKI